MGTFTARAIRIRIHRSSTYFAGIRPSNLKRKATAMERATRAISASRKNIARVRRVDLVQGPTSSVQRLSFKVTPP